MDYTIGPVWQNVDAALEQELVDFWIAEKVFATEGPARARAGEVVCVGRAPDGKIAGVCSVVPRILPRLRERMYYYRSYVRAADRKQGLALQVLKSGKEPLQGFQAALPKPRVIGIVLEIENRAVAAYHNEAFWRLTGYTFIGYSPRGFDMRVQYFDGARLQRLRPAAGGAGAGAAARPRGGAARRRPS